jgi:hypothetical protein
VAVLCDAGGGSAGTGGAVNPLAGMPIMSRTEARARMKGAIGKCVPRVQGLCTVNISPSR